MPNDRDTLTLSVLNAALAHMRRRDDHTLARLEDAVRELAEAAGVPTDPEPPLVYRRAVAAWWVMPSPGLAALVSEASGAPDEPAKAECGVVEVTGRIVPHKPGWVALVVESGDVRRERLVPTGAPAMAASAVFGDLAVAVAMEAGLPEAHRHHVEAQWAPLIPEEWGGPSSPFGPSSEHVGVAGDGYAVRVSADGGGALLIEACAPLGSEIAWSTTHLSANATLHAEHPIGIVESAVRATLRALERMIGVAPPEWMPITVATLADEHGVWR